MLHPSVKIIDIEVIGKWLVAHIWNGMFGTASIKFWVKNRDF